MTIKEEIRAVKYRQFKWALEQTKGNQRAAARMLGCTSTLFDRWMRELNLQAYAETLRHKRNWWLAKMVNQ